MENRRKKKHALSDNKIIKSKRKTNNMEKNIRNLDTRFIKERKTFHWFTRGKFQRETEKDKTDEQE
jgi:hypothetical protein